MTDPVPWLVPGPVHALVAVGLAFVLWRSARVARRRSGVVSGFLAAAFVWTWVAATPAVGNLVVRALENRSSRIDLPAVSPDGRAIVVVLASGQLVGLGGHAWPVLDADGWERVRAGIALWRRLGGQLVMVGGPGPGGQDSLAGLMQQAAREAGVPPDRLVALGGTLNTRDDVKAAAGWLTRQKPGAVWLVTSALHMPRAAAVARAAGLKPVLFPCGYRQLPGPGWRAWLPDNGDPALWRDGLHEALGLAVYRLRGWAH